VGRIRQRDHQRDVDPRHRHLRLLSGAIEFDRFGIGTITAVNEPNPGDDHGHAPRCRHLATETHLWAHGCFSDVEGYPQLVGVWGGRLIFVKDTS
jgi:hypothetical protein